MEDKCKKHLSERRKAKQNKFNSRSADELEQLQLRATMDLNRLHGSRGRNTTPTSRPSEVRKESKK